ncbi:hypothetical protein WJX82_009174 [Trebouxia sp. C0006]
MATKAFAKGLQGVLTKYGPENAHSAFISGDDHRHLILIGGLGDGLLLAPYVANLESAARNGGWSLVQPTLRSALQGWGVGSLQQDADDLLMLTKYLKAEHASEESSCKHHMQVSDREYQAGKATTADRLKTAEQMIRDGQGEDILFRDDDPVGTPVCASRFVSLASKHGDDDMFSSDFTDQELKGILGHMAEIPTMLVLGGEDECMPKSVDGRALGKRMQKAIGNGAQLTFIPKGTHSLEGTEEEFVKELQPFVKQCFGPAAATIKPPYLYSCT